MTQYVKSRNAWLILATGFLILFIGGGARFAIGLTLKPMVDELNWTRSDLGVAVGVFQVITAFAMFWSGRLADRASLRALLGWGLIVSGASIGAMSLVTQPWHALVLFGFIYAFANGLISVSTVGVMVTRAFPDRAGFANGIASAGMSVGQLVIIAIMAAVLVAIGWRSVFVWLGLAHLLFLPLILWAVPGKAETARQAPGPVREGMSLAEAMRTRQFWMLIVIYAICGLDDFFVATHVAAFASDRGLNTFLAGNLLAFMGIAGLVGVVAAGAWGDKTGPVFGTALSFIARIAVFLLVMIDQSPLSVGIFSLVFGLTFLVTAPLTVLFIRDSFGLKNMGAIGGIIVMVHHIFGGFGAWLGAAIFDMEGSYTQAFTIMFIASTVALITTLLYKPLKRPTLSQA
jgi:predicted MFS family arabinose efflux permease